MKFDFPEVYVVHGDIEITEKVDQETWDKLYNIMQKTKKRPLVTVTLECEQNSMCITLTNWFVHGHKR
jgi:hypothetical protein